MKFCLLKSTLGASLVSVMALAATPAAAISSVFFDRTAFSAVAGPLTVDAGAPSLSDFGITAGPSASIAIGDFSNTMPGQELAFSGDENFNVAFNNVAFPDPIFSFGLDFIEPTGPNPPNSAANGCNVAVCVDSTFEFTLFANGVGIETLSFRPIDDAAQDEVVFFGFISDTAFDAIQVREVVGSNDNEMFQNFTVGASPLQAVPLPASALLLMGAFGMLGFAGRRGRKTA